MKYSNPVAFTGAGISVASGLPTFDITWRGMPARDMLTRTRFERQPELFYEFFAEVEKWGDVEPNPAHLALAAAGMTVVTQNIDGLHQKAGSEKVFEIHGNLREMVCVHCGKLYPWRSLNEGIPHCDECHSILKPNVVLFEESLLQWDEAVETMQAADLVVVIGSSLAVAPACYLPKMARESGAELYAINDAADVKVPELLRQLGLL